MTDKKKFSDRTIRLARFCKDGCVVCNKARERGSGFFYWMVKVERHVCPMKRFMESPLTRSRA